MIDTSDVRQNVGMFDSNLKKVFLQSGVPPWFLPDHSRRKRIRLWQYMRSKGMRLTEDMADTLALLAKRER